MARANHQRTTDSTNSTYYHRYEMTSIEDRIGMCEGAVAERAAAENGNLFVHFMRQTPDDCGTYDRYGFNLALRIRDVIASRFVPEDNVRKETMQAADNSEQPGLAMKADVFHKVLETMVIAFDRQPDLILVGLDDHDEMFYFKLDDWESHIPNDPMDCSPDEILNDPMDCSP